MLEYHKPHECGLLNVRLHYLNSASPKKVGGVLRMYAIIETGGKQYKVSEGDVVFVEKLGLEADAAVTFDRVLAVGGEGDVKVGAPYVEGASVTAKVEKNGKDKKIIVFKYKPKKGYRRKQGHRQPYTKVVIEKINA